MNYIAIGGLCILALLLGCFRKSMFDNVKAVCIFLGLSMSNFASLWFIDRISTRNSWIRVLCLPAIFILVHASMTLSRSFRSNNLKPTLCLIGALSLTACMFLNFGLSVVLGLMYAPVLLFSPTRPSYIWRAITGLCSPLGVFFIFEAARHPLTSFLHGRLLTWNYGIPFLIWQPLVLLAGCYSYSENPSVQKVLFTKLD